MYDCIHMKLFCSRKECHPVDVCNPQPDAEQTGRLLHLRRQSDHTALFRGRHLEHLPGDGEDLRETGKDDNITLGWLTFVLALPMPVDTNIA